MQQQEEATTAVETVTTATAAVDADTSAPAEEVTTSSASASVAEDFLAPIKGVKPLPMSSDWEERMRDMGVPPESFIVEKQDKMTSGEEEHFQASRHYFMGWYYLQSAQPGRAIEQFTEALKLDPDNSHILLDTARARLAVHEISEAQELITKVLEQETTNVYALRLKAEAFLAAGDSAPGDEKEKLQKQAVETLEQARKIEPNNLDVLRSLAKAYVQQQNVEKVIETYREIVKVDPRDTYSLLILAQVLSRMERPDEAIEYYKRVIEQRRGFIGGYIYLGQLYERLKRYDDALDLYKQALLVEPHNVDVLRRFEDLLRQVNGSKNTAKILDGYKAFAAEYPLNTEVQRLYAERLLDAEMTNEAIAQYKKVLEIDPENSDAWVSLGKIYTDQKEFEKASEALLKAVDINPDKIDLYDSIANTFLARAEVGEAEKLYRRAIEANPNAEKLYISLAALLENDKQTTEAMQVMESAVAKVGEKPELLAVLGKFYRGQGNNEKAKETLQKAYKTESDNLALYGELMSLYLEEGNTTAAEEITSKTASGTTTAKDVVYSVAAEFYFNSGRNQDAIELYQQALDLNPVKLDYLGRLVGISNRQKTYDRSLDFIVKYGPRIKDQDNVMQLKGEVLLAAKRYDEAIAIYRNLQRENPLDLDYYQLLVDAYNEAGRYDDSIAVAREAKERLGDKDPAAINMLMGMVYYKNKKYPEAEKTFQELIKQTKGQSDDAYYFLGSVYLDQKQYDKAEKAFRKAIDINPNSANALNALGFMFADRGVKLDEATELISRALEINPTAPHILDSMGWVLFKKGDLQGAEKYIQKASRQYEDAEILDHLGIIYEEMGKKELARQMFERVLELDPSRQAVKKRLQELGANVN